MPQREMSEALGSTASAASEWFRPSHTAQRAAKGCAPGSFGIGDEV